MSERQNLVDSGDVKPGSILMNASNGESASFYSSDKQLQEEAENRRKSSDFQSWMNSAKLAYGNAYLSIPNVFSKTGWLGGIVLFSLVGVLNIYTMMQNLIVAERYPRLHSYSEIGGKIFGKWGKIAVDVPIWIMQLSTCCSYLYFIAE